MSDKPAGNIKTALERFQSYCAAKGIPEKSSLAHIHKISQFEEHERKELRAAYEALKAENEKLEAHFGGALDSIREHQQICNALKAENEAQAKRIAELEDDNKYLKQLSFSAIDTSNQYEIKKKTLMRSLALLEKVTKHFTRVPSTLADSEIRSEVHAFLSESKNGDSK